jgi:hypothetical protein
MRRPVYEIQEGSCLAALQVEMPFVPGTFQADIGKPEVTGERVSSNYFRVRRHPLGGVPR